MKKENTVVLGLGMSETKLSKTTSDIRAEGEDTKLFIPTLFLHGTTEELRNKLHLTVDNFFDNYLANIDED
jgi:hypothetical protein